MKVLRVKMLLLFVSVFIVHSTSHTITLLDVPRWSDPKRPAELRCHYTRQSHDPPLHSVKWYKDKHEIFRFTPHEFESRAFNSTEVQVTNSSCDLSHCVILVLGERGTSGTYTCEVSSEGPRFAVDKRTADMTISVLPEFDPLITNLPTLVYPGDSVKVNCTSDYSLPPPTIDWFIDDELQTDPSIVGETHISDPDGDGLRVSWRTLKASTDDRAILRGYASLCCRTTVHTRPPHERSWAVRLYVATRPHISMFTANSATSDAERIKTNSLMTTLWLVVIKCLL